MDARALVATWAAATLLGAVVLAIPDDDARVFSISRTHGPAPLDLLGMGVLAGGLVVYTAALVRARRTLAPRDAKRALALYAPASAFAVWSVLTDAGAWWILGVALAIGAQGWLAWRATRPEVPLRRAPGEREGDVS